MAFLRIRVRVARIEGKCVVFEEGDEFVIEGPYLKSSKPVCVHAIGALLSLLSAATHGTSLKELGLTTNEVGYLTCPDPGPPYTPGGRVLFELRVEPAT